MTHDNDCVLDGGSLRAIMAHARGARLHLVSAANIELQ